MVILDSIKSWIPTKQQTLRRRVALQVCLLVLVLGGGFVGSVYGFYQGTGQYPWLTSTAILPETPPTAVTVADVGHYLEVEKPKEIPYKEGFNCVEQALTAAWNARWQGLVGTPAKISFYGTEVEHLLLVFPTSDSGWVFVEPSINEVVKIDWGIVYWGNRIKTVDIFNWKWEPFIEEKQ